MERQLYRKDRQHTQPQLAPRRLLIPNLNAPRLNSHTLFVKLLNIDLALISVLLFASILGSPSPDLSSAKVAAAQSVYLDTAAPTLTSTPTSTPTPTPTATSTPTSTPRPTTTPTRTPLPAPSGEYPPTVTPNAAAVPKPAPLVEFPQGTINIVLLGSDKRPKDGEWRTDTVIVASVNPNVPSVTMLSIPRDLWLYIPGWMFQRVNLADVHGASVNFPGGGPGLLKQTIQYNLGVHVDYYARVDFAGFMNIIDALGGIDVVADCPLVDVFPDDPITEDPTITGTISIQTPGVYHLDGKHALWYARSRYTSPGGDLDRSRRQHRVLRGLWNKATELDAVARLPQLWSQLSSSIETDLTWNDIVWLASLTPRLDNSHIRSGFIDGDALQPWTTPSGASVYLPNTERMLEQVQDTFNPPSNIAAQAPTQIEVWNGTPFTDWDVLATDRLQWAGFWVTSLRSADRLDYARSQIIDFSTTPKGSRLPSLLRLFQLTQADVVAQPDPNSPVPYRLIVGANYNPCVRPALPHRPTPTPTLTPTAPP